MQGKQLILVNLPDDGISINIAYTGFSAICKSINRLAVCANLLPRKYVDGDFPIKISDPAFRYEDL